MTWRPGVEDWLALVGLALLGVGLWLVWPPLAFVVIGALLLVAAWLIVIWRLAQARGVSGGDSDIGNRGA